MRKIAAALLCGLFMLSARATNFSTDASDLWYNANESGWGVNVSQQYNTLFMTFFVYGPDNGPSWYVAPAVTYASISGTTLTFTGALYQTAGPWFGGSFNPGNVATRQVGSVTFNLTSPTAAIMVYTVDGVSVSKSLTRQTWTGENFTGDYVGGQTGTSSGCSANGPSEDVDVFNVTQNGTSFSMVATSALNPSASCTFTGTYSQAGHLGAVAGNYQCTGGAKGSFAMTQLEGTLSGFTAQLTICNGGCTFSGRLGGGRRSN